MGIEPHYEGYGYGVSEKDVLDSAGKRRAECSPGRGQAGSARTGQSGSRILVLGDDGPMAALLAGRLGSLAVEREANILDGIVRVADGVDALILLNAEVSAGKTAEAVGALRCVAPSVPVVLYGSAVAEAYSGAGLAAGAHDFLVWPVRLSEIKSYLSNGTSCGDVVCDPRVAHDQGEAGERVDYSRDITLPESDTAGGLAVAGELLGMCHELAMQVSHGLGALVDYAERLLPGPLGVAWVRVHTVLGDNDNGVNYDTLHAAEPSKQDAAMVVPLYGPAGGLGEMFLGPTTREVACGDALVEQAATFLGTLLHLTQRDASLRQLATVDELTGAYNRRYVQYFVREIMRHHEEADTQMTLLLFDIDEFKHYNDTYGHGAGDAILREVHGLVRRCCRAHDVVARMGGDEFVVLFWDAGVGDDRQAGGGAKRRARGHWQHSDIATFLSNRFRRLIQTNEFPMLGSEARGSLTISGGIAGYPEDGASFDELLVRADEALLEAKRSGKNRIHLVESPNQ